MAARYAKAPTYSEMLANEARNVARAAEAAAVAAGEARDAAQAILVGLDVDRDAAMILPKPETSQYPSHLSLLGLSNATRRAVTKQTRGHGPGISLPRRPRKTTRHSEEEEPIAPVQPLPAKLIEFPRELVAARKARPRLVEGPLREEYDRDSALAVTYL